MMIFKNAKILTMVQEEVFIGDLAVNKGKIALISSKIEAGENDESLDLNGRYVMPGIVDAHSHIGMWEDSLDFEGADGNECTDPITPQLRAIDAINPFDKCFVEAREAGVTTVMTGPGSANVIGGSFVAMKTAGCCLDDMIIKSPAAMKIAFGENPKRVYSEQKRAPMTRMATAALLREALYKAKEYAEKLADAETSGDTSKKPGYDAKCEALLPVLQGEIPLKAHAHRADDILTALRIAKEFDLDITLDHCTDGHAIGDVLQRENVKIILGPLFCDRSKPELRSLSMETPKRLHEKGIEFALMTDHPVTPEQYLLLTAALAAREGLDEWAALRAITITPAKILGLDDRLGSLAPGKDADLAVYNEHPLDIKSKPQLVLINGEIVSNRLF